MVYWTVSKTIVFLSGLAATEKQIADKKLIIF